MSMSVVDGRPDISFLPLPHPSGVAVNRRTRTLYVASTRNPNQIFSLRPNPDSRILMPSLSYFYPGGLYLHDLALIGNDLYANAVGQNAVIKITPNGMRRKVWWPKAIERNGKPDFSRNHLQLNSIAAGRDMRSSYFSASTARAFQKHAPGDLEFNVDHQGVIFSGRTRDVYATGLTRPHSARLHRGRIWVDNSGYGEFGVIAGSEFEPVIKLRGWTRGLVITGHIAFVGTSKILPRFRHYAPGVSEAACGISAVDLRTGAEIANLKWPEGNQIFGIDWFSRRVALGLPYNQRAYRRSDSAVKDIFYQDPEI